TLSPGEANSTGSPEGEGSTGEQEEPSAAAATSEPTLPTVSSAPIQVYVIAQQRAWMRVIVDGRVEFEGRVVSGSAYPFSGDERIEVLTGNGAGLRIIHNQADLGSMGTFGEVVARIFTLEGIQTPTPTLTPTGMPPADTTTPTPAETPQTTVTPTP
ncbi:MAG: DUF4115 domain-containing protein, partial [Chloroflexota bacterium]